MKKTIPISYLFFCGVLMVSCTKTIVLEVFNNARRDVEIISYERGPTEEHYLIHSEGSARVQFSSRLKVRLGTNTWIYNVLPVPKTTIYMKSEGLGPLVIKLQIQSDGSIYVLSPVNTVAVSNLPPQPTGYPLTPK